MNEVLMHPKIYKSCIFNNDIEVEYGDGYIKSIYIIINNEKVLIADSTKNRNSAMEVMYQEMKKLNITNIIEAGIGTGANLPLIKSVGLEYKIIEYNRHVFELFDEEHLIYGDFFEYIKQDFNNTCFITRFCMSRFDNITEYMKYILKYFSAHLHKNNYICIECDKNIFNNSMRNKVAFTHKSSKKVDDFNDSEKTHFQYIIKL